MLHKIFRDFTNTVIGHDFRDYIDRDWKQYENL